MSIRAYFLFLAGAFYLGYFAESSILGHKAKMVMWGISLGMAILPLCELIYEAIKGAMR